MSIYLKLIFSSIILLFQSTLCNAQLNTLVYSKDKEANASYLKALDYIKIGNPRTGGSADSLLLAVQLLEKAVKKDTLFKTAYLELGKTYQLFSFSFPNYHKYSRGGSDNSSKAKSAILKVLQLDSMSAEAYAQLARINLNNEYNWDEALQNFAKAIQYDPNNASNYASYGQALALKGKWDEGQMWITKANTMSPTNGAVLSTTNTFYLWKRDYDKAISFAQKIIPENTASLFLLGLTYLGNGNIEKALEALNKAFPAYNYEKSDGGSKALIAYALIRNSQIEEGKKLLNKTYELNQLVGYRAAACYVALGDYNKAIDLLEEDFQQRSNWMIWLKYDYVWDPMRTKKRFKKLLKKMSFG